MWRHVIFTARCGDVVLQGQLHCKEEFIFPKHQEGLTVRLEAGEAAMSQSYSGLTLIS